jgi:tetratricopeptide (TPR) repeat protein
MSEAGMRGRAALEAGEVDKAYAILAEASAHNAESPGDQMAFADAAMAAERYDEAFMAYERALILREANAEAMMGMGRAAEAMGAPTLALQYYRAAVLHGRGGTYRQAYDKTMEIGEVVARR